MALKTFLFVVTNCLCIYSCYSLPALRPNVSFADFVLDGKKDCGIVNNDERVISLFKTISCPSEVKIYSPDYFYQRDFLPCFGAYDALYNLCQLPLDKINYTIPESFDNPNKFCTEAKVVYDHHPFNYKNDLVKKWGEALLSTMTNETLCNNLCVLNNEINPVCIAMLTFANEYIRLKDTSESVLKLANPVVNKLLNNQTTLIKTTSEDNRASDTLAKDTIDINMDKSDKITNYNRSLISGSNDLPAQPEKSSNVAIETKKGNQDSQSVPKTSIPIDKLDKPSPAVEIPTDERKSPETETLNKEMKASNNEKTEYAPPVTGTNIASKVSPSITDESINEDNEKTITEIDDIHAENEEAMPVETREKGETAQRHFSTSSPFPFLLNVPHSLNPLKTICTPRSLYEENEKPNEEEKNTVPDTEQHAAYHAPSFNAMNDNFSESEDSYSFTYIVTTMAALCCVYLLFHYRNKLLALALEGRKGRGSRGRGRPSSANYSKLHSNLEEAIASNVTTPSATHVLY